MACCRTTDPIGLNTDTVDLWQVPLDPPAACIDDLAGLLATEERARADRFQFEHLRQRYVVGRGVLRMLLSRYTQCPPDQLVFAYGPHGKPALATKDGGDGLEFNLAHCNDVALLAFAVGRRIGVDVERVRPFADMVALAARYFSSAERRAFALLPANQQVEAFYAGWTRKEAFIKATGEGLTRPLDSFTVSLAPDQALSLVQIHDQPDTAQQWRVLHLEAGQTYCGALVVEGVDWSLRRQDTIFDR